MKRIVMVVVLFAMLILGSIETDAMDIERGKELFCKEYRYEFAEIKGEYGSWNLIDTDYGFVMVFDDEEESEYSMIDYDFEQNKATAWSWKYEKEEEEFDWQSLIIEKVYEKLEKF